MTGSPYPRPALGAPPAWEFPKVDKYAMANGMTVIACHLPDRPVIEMVLVVDGGFEQETPSQAGTALVVAQSLLEGTQLHANDELFDALESLGTYVNANPSWNGIITSMSAPRSRLAPALELFTEVVTMPEFSDQNVANVVSRTIGQVVAGEMMPQVATMNEFNRAAFNPDSRYSIPASGVAQSLATIDGSAARRWWSTWVRPASATLVVVGDLRALDLEAMLGKTLEQWVSDPLAVVDEAPESITREGGCSIIDFPQGVQTTLAIGQAFQPVALADEPAFFVANHALGGYFSSRLVTQLREEKGLTYGVQCGMDTRPRASALMILTAVDQSATAEAVEDVKSQIQATTTDLTENEVRKAIGNLVQTAPVRFKSATNVAQELVGDVVRGRPVGHSAWVREQFSQVTPADAMEAFSRYVDVGRVVVAASGPAARIKPELEQVAGTATVRPAGALVGARNEGRSADT